MSPLCHRFSKYSKRYPPVSPPFHRKQNRDLPLFLINLFDKILRIVINWSCSQFREDIMFALRSSPIHFEPSKLSEFQQGCP